MAGGKSRFGATKPDLSFFKDKPKVEAAPLIIDEPSTGPRPVKAAPASTLRGYAAAVKTGLPDKMHSNKLTVWNIEATASQGAGTSKKASNTWADVAVAPIKESIPAWWKKADPPKKLKKSESRESSMSSEFAKSSASSKSLETANSSTSTEQLKPLRKVSENSTSPAKKASSKPETTLKMVSYGGSAHLSTSASFPSLSEPSKKSYCEVAGGSPPTETKKAQEDPLTNMHHQKKNEPRAPAQQPQTTQQLIPTEKKSRNKNKKKGTETAALSSTHLETAGVATEEKQKAAKKVVEQVVEKVHIQKVNKDFGEMLDNNKVDSKKADKTKVGKKVAEGKTISKKKSDKPVIPKTSAAVSNMAPDHASAERVQIADVTEDVPTPIVTDIVAVDFAQDVAPRSDQQGAPAPSKKTRKNKMTGAQRKKAVKNRTAEEAAAAALIALIENQVAAVKLSGEDDAAQRKLPVDTGSLETLVHRDSKLALQKDKKYAEKALREALLANAAKPDGDRVSINQLPAYAWFRTACGQPVFQDRAAEMLKATVKVSFGVESMAAPSKAPSSKQKNKEKNDKKKRAAIVAQVPKTLPPTLPVGSLSVSSTAGLNFGMPQIPDVPQVSAWLSPTATFGHGRPFSTRFVFGSSTVATKIDEAGAAALEPNVAESSATEPEIAESKGTEFKLAEPKLLEAVTAQPTAISEAIDPQTAEMSESDDLATDTNVTLASGAELSTTDDESKPATPEEQEFEPFAAPTEHHSSFLCGDAFALALIDEEPSVDEKALMLNIYPTENIGSFVTGTALVLRLTEDEENEQDEEDEKALKLNMLPTEHVGSNVTGTALVLAATAEELCTAFEEDTIVWKAVEPCVAVMEHSPENAAELPRVCITKDGLQAFVSVLPQSAYSFHFAPKVALEIPVPDPAFRLATYMALPPRFESVLQSGGAPTNATPNDDRRVTVFTPLETTRPFRGRLINIQIGIVMLGEFLGATNDRLAISYTLIELIEAFLAMSNYEINELDLGQEHRVTAAMVRNYKYLQNRIVIGSIKLSDFLAMIKFNANGIATAHSVIEAWKVCAEKDQEADVFNTQREASA